MSKTTEHWLEVIPIILNRILHEDGFCFILVSKFRVDCDLKPLMIQARGHSKPESAKIRNRRMQKKVRYHSPFRKRPSEITGSCPLFERKKVSPFVKVSSFFTFSFYNVVALPLSHQQFASVASLTVTFFFFVFLLRALRLGGLKCFFVLNLCCELVDIIKILSITLCF